MYINLCVHQSVEIPTAVSHGHRQALGSAAVPVLAALLQIADPAHVLYGSAYPYTPAPLAANLAARLDACAHIPPALQRAFMRDNALAMFPGLRP